MPSLGEDTAAEGAWTVVVADDHPLVREAMRHAFDRAKPNVRVLEAESLPDAQEVVEREGPVDLVVLDLNMPGMNGFAGLAELRAQHPTVPVAIVSATTDEVVIRRALEFGAVGFIPKSAPLDIIAEAIRQIMDGQVWTPPTSNNESADLKRQVAQRVAELTPQQLKVLALMSEGLLNKQIAHRLSVGEPTVKAHVTVILRKLGVHSRTQAVIAARLLDLQNQ